MFARMRSRIGRHCLALALALALAALAIGYIAPDLSFAASLSAKASTKNASVPAPNPGEKKVVLKNLGMACPFCKAAISAKLKQTPGVIAYDVDLKTDSATVLYDPAKVTVEKLKQAIAETGFQVRAVEEIER